MMAETRYCRTDSKTSGLLRKTRVEIPSQTGGALFPGLGGRCSACTGHALALLRYGSTAFSTKNSRQKDRPDLQPCSSKECSSYIHPVRKFRTTGRAGLLNRYVGGTARRVSRISLLHLRDGPQLRRRNCGTGRPARRCCRRPSGGTS